MESGIYHIRNESNGKYYIGSSIDVTDRFKSHISDLDKNRHGNDHLQAAWNKYGGKAFTFKVLKTLAPDRIRIVEQLLIDHTRCLDERYGYNINPTVDNSRHAERTKEKIRKAWTPAKRLQASLARQSGWTPSERERVRVANSPATKADALRKEIDALEDKVIARYDVELVKVLIGMRDKLAAIMTPA